MRELLTPDVFNALIVLNLAVGLLLAVWQLRRDLRRTRRRPTHHDDTQPHRTDS